MLSTTLLLLALSAQCSNSNQPCYDEPRLHTEHRNWALPSSYVRTPPRTYRPPHQRARPWPRVSVIAWTRPGSSYPDGWLAHGKGPCQLIIPDRHTRSCYVLRWVSVALGAV
jgi:hypothetical protein